ncbi:uncharacterized protein BX663DRAFT_282223 [Cokeromyces recurvatus]|uniref:uncharacterized protein n=1 Tax=Cokeromyces recurvatus TaxID=90255 RepID=UPI002220386E|nr:uncharacterized protein BX663DRAFT_282223 [Cokeromyces recurvatus]KAI7905437.1 hypothetical protein BX663DRAFT_282223 [Cokeromyces recurvatus]
MTIDQENEKNIKPSSKYAIIRWFGLDRFDPELAVTSFWVSSKLFFFIRLILAFYAAIVLWTDIGITHKGSFFAYFTSLTFIGLHAYQVTTIVHHFRYLYTKRDISFFNDQPKILNYLYVVLYSTIVTFNIVTPVVYWSLLAKGNSQEATLNTWINVSVHGVSFFLMIFEVILNRMKLPVRHVIFPLVIIISYMLMTFIIYACNGFWVYPFLDWKQGSIAALWYFLESLIIGSMIHVYDDKLEEVIA